MRNVHDTITRLKAIRGRTLLQPDLIDGQLGTLSDFGSNPGALQARTHLPKSIEVGAPLVVVLHGCTQTPGGYNRSAAWSEAAEEYGFALLFPEQQRANNPNLCFNWFLPEDASRGRGEALSIRQMVAAMHERHGTDPRRTFVTGLSAGGAMAAVMLATYPEVFAGGAIIAGLPYGTARTAPEAFDRMRGHAVASPEALAAIVRSASHHEGPWPRLSVWHGTIDATVDSSNARAIVDQWARLHGLPRDPSRKGTVNGFPHRIWENEAGDEVIEEYVITGMGHGAPLNQGEGLGETAGPFMLDVGISSTRRIASFWGIAEPQPGKKEAPLSSSRSEINPHHDLKVHPGSPVLMGGPVGVQRTIEEALRAAGLMP